MNLSQRAGAVKHLATHHPPDNEDAKRFFLALKEAANSGRNGERLATYLHGREVRCFAGRLFCRINHDGRVFPCPMAEEGRHRIRDSSTPVRGFQATNAPPVGVTVCLQHGM